jgi:hypothetical protein
VSEDALGTEAANPLTTKNPEISANLRARAALQDRKFRKFIAYFIENEQPYAVALRLQKAGVDLHRDVFIALRVYAERGGALRTERKKRGREMKNEINRRARAGELTADAARALLERCKTAFDVSGLSPTRCVDSLAIAQMYLEAKTGKRPSASDLSYLLDAINFAFGRKPEVVDWKSIETELRRWRRANPRYLESLKGGTVL